MNFGFVDKADDNGNSSSDEYDAMRLDEEVTLYENHHKRVNTESKRDGLLVPPTKGDLTPPESPPSYRSLLTPKKRQKNGQEHFELTLASRFKGNKEFGMGEELRSLVEKLPSKRMSLKVKAAAIGQSKKEVTDDKQKDEAVEDENVEDEKITKKRKKVYKPSKFVLTSRHKLKYYPKVLLTPKSKAKFDLIRQEWRNEEEPEKDENPENYEADGENSDFDQPEKPKKSH